MRCPMTFELCSTTPLEEAPAAKAVCRIPRPGRAPEADSDSLGEAWEEVFASLQWLAGHTQGLCCREPLRDDLAIRGALLGALREAVSTSLSARMRPSPTPPGAITRALEALKRLGRALAIARGRGLLGEDDFLGCRRQVAKVTLGLRLLQAEQILGSPRRGGDVV